MKGQLTVEYYISLILFAFFIAYLAFQLIKITPDFMNALRDENLRIEAYKLSELLINDPGEPVDWEKAAVSLVISDSFTDETKIATKENVFVDTTTRQVKLGLQCYCDNDGDGFYSTIAKSVTVATCAGIGCLDTVGNDCDDNCSYCYPGSTNYTDSPDGKDQDCDGTVDEENELSCVSAPNTNWGANTYNCIGADKRCYNGECKTCGGWVYQAKGYYCTGDPYLGCWYVATTDRETCDSACATHGGCVITCWDDQPTCDVCYHFYPGATSCSKLGGACYPYVPYIQDSKFCGNRYRANCLQSCSATLGPSVYKYNRFCVCNY